MSRRVAIAGRPLLSGNSAWLMPNTSTAGAGMADYYRPLPVPSDVRAVSMELGNYIYTGGLGVDITLGHVAIGTSDGAGGFASAPTQYASQVVPGDGSVLVIPSTPVVRGADKCVMFAFAYPGGLSTGYADNLFCGRYAIPATGTLFPNPGAFGNDTQPLFRFSVGYQSARPRYHIMAADSIAVGAAIPATDCGYLNAAWVKLGMDYDLAVTVNGMPGAFLNQFADLSTYPLMWTRQTMNGAVGVIQASVNDSATDSAPTMLANVDLIAAHGRSLGLTKVIATTCLPAGAYGSIAVRDAYNAALLAASTTVDQVIDIRPAVWDPMNHDVIDATYLAGGAGFHPNTAGNVQIAALIAAELGL